MQRLARVHTTLALAVAITANNLPAYNFPQQQGVLRDSDPTGQVQSVS